MRLLQYLKWQVLLHVCHFYWLLSSKDQSLFKYNQIGIKQLVKCNKITNLDKFSHQM
jgi:hypothetical protein